jgi:hypothetical protein
MMFYLREVWHCSSSQQTVYVNVTWCFIQEMFNIARVLRLFMWMLHDVLFERGLALLEFSTNCLCMLHDALFKKCLTLLEFSDCSCECYMMLYLREVWHCSSSQQIVYVNVTWCFIQEFDVYHKVLKLFM